MTPAASRNVANILIFIDDFYLQVAFALSGCQLVEQELKLYISQALDLAKKCIGRRMPFNMSGDDYEDASLERLIEVFRKLSDKDVLVGELRKFKTERNFLSHQGIAHCLDPMGELGEISSSEFKPRPRAVQTEAERLRLAIHEEAGKFLGHLYFENIPQ